MNKKTKVGSCKICGNVSKLSFEHIPPKSTNNKHVVYTQNFEQLYHEDSYIYGKKSKLNQGYGKYSLCETCNRNTGSWYVNDFKDFCSQGLNQLDSEKESFSVHDFEFQIKPLSVIKQIMVMFMANENTNIFQNDKSLVDFVLKPENQKLPKKYNLYLYTTLSRIKKMIGFTMIDNPQNGMRISGAEISCPPFGYLLLLESNVIPQMQKINNFSYYEHMQSSKFRLHLPYYKINNPILCYYSK